MPDFDVVVVGAGLAGACAALHLSRKQRVLLLDANEPASGASGAAAGLLSPMMARKARLAWHADTALDALHHTLDLANTAALFKKEGVLRPVLTEDQIPYFHEAAARHPEHAAWCNAEALCEQFPDLHAPLGALRIHQGGAIDIAAFVHSMVAAAQANGAQVRTQTRVTGWEETQDAAFVDLGAERVTTRRVVLALGYGFRHHADLVRLGLHGVKGQVVRVRLPHEHRDFPLLAGHGYIVPAPTEGDYIVGSSYEHSFADQHASVEKTREILDRATQMLPALADATVLDATAGVRVTMRGSRLPVVGPLPEHRRVWVLSAFGSKGLLLAPLLARRLATFFDAPDDIPKVVRLRRR